MNPSPGKQKFKKLLAITLLPITVSSVTWKYCTYAFLFSDALQQYGVQ